MLNEGLDLTSVPEFAFDIPVRLIFFVLFSNFTAPFGNFIVDLDFSTVDFGACLFFVQWAWKRRNLLPVLRRWREKNLHGRSSGEREALQQREKPNVTGGQPGWGRTTLWSRDASQPAGRGWLARATGNFAKQLKIQRYFFWIKICKHIKIRYWVDLISMCLATQRSASGLKRWSSYSQFIMEKHHQTFQSKRRCLMRRTIRLEFWTRLKESAPDGNLSVWKHMGNFWFEKIMSSDVESLISWLLLHMRIVRVGRGLLGDHRQLFSLQVRVDRVSGTVHGARVPGVQAVHVSVEGLFLAKLLPTHRGMRSVHHGDVVDRVGRCHGAVEHVLRIARTVLLWLVVARELRRVGHILHAPVSGGVPG